MKEISFQSILKKQRFIYKKMKQEFFPQHYLMFIKLKKIQRLKSNHLMKNLNVKKMNLSY